MPTLRPSTENDNSQVMAIWRKAVDATHDFLAPEDRSAIERELTAFFPQVQLTLCVDHADMPLGFMFLHDGHLEALFVDPDHHGKGIGRILVHAALAEFPGLTTDVNEQNGRAAGFYERLGFERIGRSPTDSQGRPYPIVKLRFRPSAPEAA